MGKILYPSQSGPGKITFNWKIMNGTSAPSLGLKAVDLATLLRCAQAVEISEVLLSLLPASLSLWPYVLSAGME